MSEKSAHFIFLNRSDQKSSMLYKSTNTSRYKCVTRGLIIHSVKTEKRKNSTQQKAKMFIEWIRLNFRSAVNIYIIMNWQRNTNFLRNKYWINISKSNKKIKRKTKKCAYLSFEIADVPLSIECGYHVMLFTFSQLIQQCCVFFAILLIFGHL